jgi:hypothetical protein
MSATCRGCGKNIVWAILENGKKIPLDPTPPCYVLTACGGPEPAAVRDRGVMVSHFATCPKANQFSGSKKKEANDGRTS